MHINKAANLPKGSGRVAEDRLHGTPTAPPAVTRGRTVTRRTDGYEATPTDSLQCSEALERRSIACRAVVGDTEAAGFSHSVPDAPAELSTAVSQALIDGSKLDNALLGHRGPQPASHALSAISSDSGHTVGSAGSGRNQSVDSTGESAFKTDASLLIETKNSTDAPCAENALESQPLVASSTHASLGPQDAADRMANANSTSKLDASSSAGMSQHGRPSRRNAHNKQSQNPNRPSLGKAGMVASVAMLLLAVGYMRVLAPIVSVLSPDKPALAHAGALMASMSGAFSSGSPAQVPGQVSKGQRPFGSRDVSAGSSNGGESAGGPGPVTVVAVVGGGHEMSPYGASWGEVAGHIGQRLTWVDSNFEMNLFTDEEIQGSKAAEFQQAIAGAPAMLLGLNLQVGGWRRIIPIEAHLLRWYWFAHVRAC